MYPPPPTAVGSVTLTATSVTNTAAFASANVNISTSGGLAGQLCLLLERSGLQYRYVYSLAGAVPIAADGTLTGEQDYNDGSGITSPEPGGDMITSGSLSFDPASWPRNANSNTNNRQRRNEWHGNSRAQFRKQQPCADYSGGWKRDIQRKLRPADTAKHALAGGFSFALSGAGSNGNTHFFGGVFTVAGTSVTNGLVDKNDAGNVSTDNSFTGTLTAADSLAVAR